MAVILIDDASTWPDGLRAAARDLADTAKGECSASDDMDLDAGTAQELAEALTEHSVRAYHCTRLLNSEKADIEANGMRVLSVDLIEKKLQGALAENQLSEDHYEHMLNNHMFATNECRDPGSRLELLHFVGERRTFATDTHSINRQLGCWGGEAVYVSEGLKNLPDLRTIGTPTIIAADVPIRWAQKSFAIELTNRLAATVLDIEVLRLGPIIKRDLPADLIHAMWRPGIPEFDAYPELIKK